MNVVRRIVVDEFATDKTGVVHALCSTDLAKDQFDMSGTDAQALEHVKNAIRQLHAVRSGMTFAIEDVLEDGDTIWARVRGPGAARGPLFGPPRGRPVEITLVDVAGSLGCAPVVCSPDPDRVLDRLAPMP